MRVGALVGWIPGQVPAGVGLGLALSLIGGQDTVDPLAFGALGCPRR